MYFNWFCMCRVLFHPKYKCAPRNTLARGGEFVTWIPSEQINLCWRQCHDFLSTQNHSAMVEAEEFRLSGMSGDYVVQPPAQDRVNQQS